MNPMVSIWKHNCNGWERFSRFVKFEVGSGFHIRFWFESMVWGDDL